MISSMKPNDILRLCAWEECLGKLEEIEEVDGNWIAVVGKFRINVSNDLKQRLLPYLGSRVSILRTSDLPVGEEYLFRVLGSETSPDEKSLKEARQWAI
jgi:hypothetical protein